MQKAHCTGPRFARPVLAALSTYGEFMASPVEPTIFLQVRDWLEILYFLSGIIVMILVAFGLWQLKIAKDQLETTKEIFKTQCKRAAVESAVIECRRFSETCVQSSLALRKYCIDNEIKYFEQVEFEETDNGFKLGMKKVEKEGALKLVGAEVILNEFINGLEAYALFFLSGVADEKIAFHSNGSTFVELCEIAFKVFPVAKVSDEDAKPIKALYFMWREKLKANKLKVEQRNIEEKLQGYEDKTLRAIGT